MRVALDVDDCLCKFTEHAHNYYGVPINERVDYWSIEVMNQRLGVDWFRKIEKNEEFWITLPILAPPSDIDFEVYCYMSSFPASMFEIRKDWLRENKFPEAPLVVTSDKKIACERLEITHLIDDKPQTIRDLMGTNIKGIHFHNHYAGFEPVGDYVVNNLNQVKQFL